MIVDSMNEEDISTGSVRSLVRIARWMLLDVLVIATSYIIALYTSATPTPFDYGANLRFIAFATVLTSVCLYSFSVYRRIWSMTSGHDVKILVNAIGLATLAVLFANTFKGTNALPLNIILIGNTLALSGLVATRYRSRLFKGMSWRWRAVWNQEFPKESAAVVRVLIVGAGESGQVLALRLRHRFPQRDYRYEVVGFADMDSRKQGMYIEGCKVLGFFADIPNLSQEYKVDLIAIAADRMSGAGFREVLAYCESTNARIKVIPDMFALMSAPNGDTALRNVCPEDLIGRTPITFHEGVDLSLVAQKTILVTGAAGSIGSELCRQLCHLKVPTLILLDNNESDLHELGVELSTRFPEVKLIPVLIDITLNDRLTFIFKQYRPQIVFHAAAYKHVPMLEKFCQEAVRVNIGGTNNLIQCAQAFHVERFVLISTDKAVNPSSVMGASKRACELMLRARSKHETNQTLFTSVRFGNVLGSRGSVLPTFQHQIDSGGPITITHPDMVRYFMSIPEAANLVIHAACLTKGDDIFLLRMGEEVRILDLAERMIRMRGLRPYVDIDIQFTGVRPGEKLHEELYSKTETLIDTVHPHIVQVKDNDKRFNASEFLACVEELVHYDSQATTPQMLYDLIGPNIRSVNESESAVAA